MTVLELISKLSQTMQRISLQPWNTQSHPFLLFLLFTTAMAFIFPIPLTHAAEVDLAWDASDRTSGYNVYYGLKSRDYEDKIDVGNNLNFTIRNLSENQVYYFAVTAYNDYGESGFSTEVSYLATLSSDTLNFSDFVIESYGGDEDKSPIVTIEDDDATLHIRGNGWKKIYFPYTLTPDTVIEFDFKSSVIGDIHGIGFDDDDRIIDNLIRTFKLYGTQSWGILDFNDYQNSAPNWKHYRIPVGEFYTGDMLYLTFTNDHDNKRLDAESYFSKIRVYDGDADD